MGHFAETIKTSSKSAEGAVSALQNEVKDLPADKRLKIEAATSEAKSGIKDVNESVDKLPKSKQVIVRTETTNAKTGVREVKESLENLPNNTKVKVSANTTGANEALKGTQKELAETGSKAKSTGSILGGAFGGTLIANGLSTLGSKLVEVTKNGLELAEQGEQTERVWENLGAGSKGAAEMSAQMVDLRAKTGYAAGDIKKMQQQFYGLTGSVDSAKNLTEALVGVGVASGLSGDKVGKLVRSMGRLFSSDSVTSSQLARIETQAPKMGSALAAAAGMSQDAFNKMVSDGKLTGSAFEDLVEKVSKQSPAAFSVFGKTGQGAIAQIKGSWISAQSVFGQKLVDTQKTGLTDVANFMKSKDFQGLLGDAAEGLGKIADKIVDVLRYVEKNKGSISEIAKATGSIITDLPRAHGTS
ncbi:tape measure protein [Lacticaseibacillus pantheris]|uniref:tape measure protein n=1 Tax=Lacticaseibacillus pantheris TaxID=171523 RepID=UPI0006D11423|nr:tape measure protein [Lacticaseibacillus pantheris]